LSVKELCDIYDRLVELREELESWLLRIDDCTIKQRGEIARVLAETEYFKKTTTIKDLLHAIVELDNAIPE
jgi:hypothetical protein